MKTTTVTVYINWFNKFITTDPFEVIPHYLEMNGITLKQFAIDNGIIEDDEEELTEDMEDDCYNLIWDDVNSGIDDWEITTLDMI